MQLLTKKLNTLSLSSVFKKKKIKINLKNKVSLLKKYYQFNKSTPNKKFFYKINKTLTSYSKYSDFNNFYKNFKY
jgi:hypothetical protein